MGKQTTPPSAILPEFLGSELARHNNWLPLGRWMELCLYHPQYGYYTRGQNFDTSGIPRDFITAPEMTPLFGYTLANWVHQTWEIVGKPAPFPLVEAGPGRGFLMRDVLIHLRRTCWECYAAARPMLMEISPVLRTVQQATLAEFPQCSWGMEIPPGAILLGNEILDAFPLNQYIFTQGRWQEVGVSATHSEPHGLQFSLQPLPEKPPLPFPSSLIPTQPTPEGMMVEHSPGQQTFLETVRTHTRAALLVDYGFTQPPAGLHWKSPEFPTGAPSGTLQAIRNHTHTHPLSTPGLADLTWHVNFPETARILGESSCQTTDMAEWLLANGLVALGLEYPAEQAALQRLLHPAQMGSLFKVLDFLPPSS